MKVMKPKHILPFLNIFEKYINFKLEHLFYDEIKQEKELLLLIFLKSKFYDILVDHLYKIIFVWYVKTTMYIKEVLKYYVVQYNFI